MFFLPPSTYILFFLLLFFFFAKLLLFSVENCLINTHRAEERSKILKKQFSPFLINTDRKKTYKIAKPSRIQQVIYIYLSYMYG